MNFISSKREARKNTQSSTLQSPLALELEGMGFTKEQIKAAVSRNSTVEAATEFILFGGFERSKLQSLEVCGICLEESEIAAMISLSCTPVAHRFCKECFVGHCNVKISDAEVSEDRLTCPAVCNDNTPCRQAITIHEIQANVPPELFARYERFMLRRVCEQQNMRRCPSCNDWYIDVDINPRTEDLWRSIQCQACSHTFCGQCGQKPHLKQKDQNISCEDLAKWQSENEGADTSFASYMKDNRIFPCPKCSLPVTWESNCKYLYCHCKAAHLCGLCGVQLKEFQHFDHFNGRPHGDTCRGPTDTRGVDAK